MNHPLGYNLIQQINSTLTSNLNVISLTASSDVTANNLIANSDVYASSMVGVGTTSPNYEIHIHDSVTDNAFIQFTHTTSGSTASDGFLIGLDSSNKGRIQLRENTNLDFYTNDNIRLTLTNSGDLDCRTNDIGNVTKVTSSVVNIGSGGFTAGKPLDVVSTTGGVVFPRMTAVQRSNISSPQGGEVIFNTDVSKLQCFDGSTTWFDHF